MKARDFKHVDPERSPFDSLRSLRVNSAESKDPAEILPVLPRDSSSPLGMTG
jgi:hypothetical protein